MKQGVGWTLLLAVTRGAHASLVLCDYFSSSTCSGEDTNYALKNYGQCTFQACGGDNVVISTRNETLEMASCQGDTFLRLLDVDGDLLGYSDDAVWYDTCSEILFSLPVPYACRTYETRIGCFGSKKDCEAQVVVDVSHTRSTYVYDNYETFNSTEGDTWTLTCDGFSVMSSQNDSEATVLDYDPITTAVCSFEVCPDRYYEVELSNCTNSITEIMSFGGADKADDLIATIQCGESIFIDGFGSTSSAASGQCHLVSMYQTCAEDLPENTMCNGFTRVKTKKYPPIDVQWLDELLASPGYPIRYKISNFTANDENATEYLNSGISDLYIAVYKKDMFENQQYCDYISVGGSSEVNFFDYIDYSLWNGFETKAYVTTPSVESSNRENYIVSEFGGKYRIIVWLWRKTLIGMDSPFLLAQTTDMRIHGPASLTISITRGSSNDYIHGFFEFTNAKTLEGDYLVLYALNEQGVCHFQHDKADYSSTLWNRKIVVADATSGDFSSEPFRLPNSTNCDRMQWYEIRYMRNGEVLARSSTLPLESPTSSPTVLVNSLSDETDYTLEYALLIIAILVAIVAALAFVVYKQKHVPSEADLAREDIKRINKKGGFQSVSADPKAGFNDDINKFLDEVDPTLFQIEMTGEEEDDDEEVTF